MPCLRDTQPGCTCISCVARRDIEAQADQEMLEMMDKHKVDLDEKAKDVETWKKIAALAMQYAGITRLMLDFENMVETHWNIRLEPDIYKQEYCVSIEHEADAIRKEPKFLFIFEGCGYMQAQRVKRTQHALTQWVRSSFPDKIAVVEVPKGGKLRIQKLVGGDFSEVDPEAVGIKIVEVEEEDDRATET